jgi:hypothetical protein
MQPASSCRGAVPEAEDYFTDQFPKERFPSCGWIERPTSFPAQAWTTETTHRDGQQGGMPLTAEQSVQIYDLLCRFTGKSGAIRQAEYFVYRKQDLDGFRAAQERHANGAPIEPTTWIRAAAKDVELIQSLGVKESGLLASISDYHVFHKFRPGGRSQAANIYLDAVQLALDAGIRPRLHLEDASRGAIDFIRYFVETVLEKAARYPTPCARSSGSATRSGWRFPTKMCRCREEYQSCSKPCGPTACARTTLSFILTMTLASSLQTPLLPCGTDVP